MPSDTMKTVPMAFLWKAEVAAAAFQRPLCRAGASSL